MYAIVNRAWDVLDKPVQDVVEDAQFLAAVEYRVTIKQSVAYMGIMFQADTLSQLALTASLLSGSVPTDFAWLNEANNFVPMTYLQLQGLANAILVRDWVAFKKLQVVKGRWVEPVVETVLIPVTII